MAKQKPDQHYQLKSLNHRFVDNTSALRSMIKAIKRSYFPKQGSTKNALVKTAK
ncbi:hypothetical protein MTO98_12590 [Mucilaginibacter sp. SMC90]|uniref:hypothetical protein n=1 Tax=Mucilaginibacter sp. SMC90 TaxID=2929803 RepID=UPI001FB2A5E7|nr:hypothetical protein [Mucilaginibacter sp. SMC90]UOE51918.1 hypothetical protein MTO98_12590 [Mucilaginibacter sp. SMC90]